MSVFDVEPAPKRAVVATLFSMPELQQILGPWVLSQCFAKAPFTPRQAMKAIPELDAKLSRANVVGDCLGHRGFKLYRDTKNRIEATFANAARVMRSHPNLDALAAQCGFETAAELWLQVTRLGWAGFDTSQREATATELGYSSADELEEAIAAL